MEKKYTLLVYIKMEEYPKVLQNIIHEYLKRDDYINEFNKIISEMDKEEEDDIKEAFGDAYSYSSSILFEIDFIKSTQIK